MQRQLLETVPNKALAEASEGMIPGASTRDREAGEVGGKRIDEGKRNPRLVAQLRIGPPQVMRCRSPNPISFPRTGAAAHFGL